MSSWQGAVSEMSFDDGCAVLSELHSVATLALSLQLDVIAALDAPSLHYYLCLQLGWSRKDAKERVAVANALLELPLLRDAFREGKLDWARLVLVCQLASTPEDDELYAKTATDHTLNQLKVMLARKKAGDVTKAQRAQGERFARFRHDDQEQRSVLEASFPLDIGIAIEKLVQGRADSFGLDAETGEYPKPQQAMADALCDLLFGENAPRVEMLVDLEPPALVGEGAADLEGHTLNTQTLQRLACDGSARASVVDDKGLPLSLGRKARLFPPWLSRQIAHRDRGCRFPGCGSTRWLHDHHLLEWDADDGPTDYDNGLQLCGTHHRYVHEGGWKVRGNPDEALTFVRADGKGFTGLAPVTNPNLTTAITNRATATAERVVREREELEERRQDEQKRREREYAKQREADRQWRKECSRYKYPDNVDRNGWGNPAA